jgi:hypothetical protein
MTKLQLFVHKYLPHFYRKKSDGGKTSGVNAYIFEWKCLFSIGLLHFKDGSRENFHSHGFNALSWFVRGWVTEEKLGGEKKDFYPSFWPKFTPRMGILGVLQYVDLGKILGVSSLLVEKRLCLRTEGKWYD